MKRSELETIGQGKTVEYDGVVYHLKHPSWRLYAEIQNKLLDNNKKDNKSEEDNLAFLTELMVLGVQACIKLEDDDTPLTTEEAEIIIMNTGVYGSEVAYTALSMCGVDMPKKEEEDDGDDTELPFGQQEQ